MSCIDDLLTTFPGSELVTRSKILNERSTLDSELQWWRTWNASRPPAPAISEIRTVQKEKYLERKARSKGVAA